MVVVSYSGREINAKIVYYGPGLCGKTTNLEKIYDSVPETHRGRMVSMKTQTDRTLFFISFRSTLVTQMKTRFLLHGPRPGLLQRHPQARVKGVDAVFVADSSPEKMAENQSPREPRGESPRTASIEVDPWVQYNKRDSDALCGGDGRAEPYNVPTFEAQAVNGGGVFETLRGISKLLLAKISKDVTERDRGSLGGTPRVADGKAERKPRPTSSPPARNAATPPFTVSGIPGNGRNWFSP
jgi:hypothetical protein